MHIINVLRVEYPHQVAYSIGVVIPVELRQFVQLSRLLLLITVSAYSRSLVRPAPVGHNMINDQFSCQAATMSEI